MYKFVLLAGIFITAVPFASQLHASAIYRYTGNNFDTFEGAGYNSTMRVIGYIELDAALPANTRTDVGTTSTDTIKPISFSFSDGRNSLTEFNADELDFFFETDAAGNIVTWFGLVGKAYPSPVSIGDTAEAIITANSSAIQDLGSITTCTSIDPISSSCESNSRTQGYNYFKPGTWISPDIQISGPNATWIYNPKSQKSTENPIVELIAIANQQGGSYSWLITRGSKKVEIVEESEDRLLLRGKSPSETLDDVEVSVYYIVNSQIFTATHNISVLRPTHLCECFVDKYAQQGDPPTLCGRGESGGVTLTQLEEPNLKFRFETLYYYAIMDQFGSLLSPDLIDAPPIPSWEKVSAFKSNYNAFPGGCPLPRWIVSPDGTVVDKGILKDVLSRDCRLLPENPPDIVTTAKQVIKIADWNVANRDFTYYYNYATSQESKRKYFCTDEPTALPYTAIVPSFTMQ